MVVVVDAGRVVVVVGGGRVVVVTGLVVAGVAIVVVELSPIVVDVGAKVVVASWRVVDGVTVVETTLAARTLAGDGVEGAGADEPPSPSAVAVTRTVANKRAMPMAIRARRLMVSAWL